MADAWDDFDDAPKRGKKPSRPADPWAAFDDHKPAERRRAPTTVDARPTGDVHDGDTFRLSDGRNGRLYGVDAFELDQTGRSPAGAVVPLGQDARTALVPYAAPDATVGTTGSSTYGRPVVTLENGGDAGQSMLDQGLALAAPEYLRRDPARLQQYMEAERLARLNRRGAFGNTFQSPSAFRHGDPDPWAKAELTDRPGPGKEAVFWDEPTPFQGLRPEIERGYLGIWQDLKSKPEDLIAFAQANGFTIDAAQTRKRYADRDRTKKPGGTVSYATPPRVLTDPGDGTLGAAARGFADPINMLDEMGGVVDSLGGTGGRESVWNSDRRFGDILWNNIDQNRSILDHDDAEYPYARFGGQMAGGLLLPGASIEGIGLRAATQVLREGGTRMAAEAAAKAAVRNRLIAVGAAQGSLAGAGASDDGGIEGRIKGGLVGAGIGGTLGGLTAVGGQAAIDAIGPRLAARASRSAVNEPTTASTVWDDFADAPMSSEIETPTLVGPEVAAPRMPDRIDAPSRPQPLTAEPTEAQRVAQAADISPRDVLPLSPNADDPGAYAGNIRLEGLDSPQAIRRALTTTDQRIGGFDAATRGRVTQEETASLAADLGMTADDLLARRRGQAFNAEQALAARQILAKSGNELVNMARRLEDMDNPGDEALGRFREAWVRHVAIQEQVSGATAEAGRALAQFRVLADSRAAPSRVLASMIDGGGGTGRIRDVARAIVDLDEAGADAAGLNRFAANAVKPRFRDKLVELWYNSLLSGPQTHVVNTLSNTLTSLAQIPEHAAAATVGAARRVLPNQRDTDRVFFSEIGARTVGFLQGTKEGLIEMGRTLRTGDPSDEASKVENASMKAISGLKGSIIRTPTRFLSAEDELFKAMARRMELNGLAIRQARQEGLKGRAARDRAAAVVANPSDDLLERSFDYGRYVTFQTPLAHDSVPGMISRMTQNHPWLKLVVPFVRTPTNILKFAAERSPAAPLLRGWRRDIRAGGAKRDLAIAKTMVGTGVMTLAAQWAGSGTITGGGPADDSAKAAMRAQGWQPYSFKLGDTYYSYARLDPFATTLGIVADAIDLQSHMTEKERDQVGTLLLGSTLQNLSSKTWLSGVSDAASAIEDPNKVQSFVGRLAGSIAVPGGVAQVARTFDPVQRDARTILDRVRARVPFASKKIEARRDIWGRVIVNEGGLGPDIMSPIRTSRERPDPASAAILDSGARATLPARRVAGRDLTPQEYGQYQSTAGSLAHQGILDRVQERDWSRLPQDERSDAIANLMRIGRAAARKDLFGGERKQPTPGNDAWGDFEDAPQSRRRAAKARP
ncbi:MAG TPA: thermonuclease family protein [Sphingomicrobium sp.]|jgi:endonuclease YncB( thermonuclease family)